MFTVEEVSLTIKQIIEHAIFDIDCKEYADATCRLKQLDGIFMGDMEEFKNYWYDAISPVQHDMESYLSFYPAETLPIVKSIIDKLDLS